MGLSREGRLNRGYTVCEYWQHMQEEHRKIVMSQEHYCTGLPMIMVISKIFKLLDVICNRLKFLSLCRFLMSFTSSCPNYSWILGNKGNWESTYSILKNLTWIFWPVTYRVSRQGMEELVSSFDLPFLLFSENYIM